MLALQGGVWFYREYFEQREVFGRTPWGITEVIFLWPLFFIVLGAVRKIDQWHLSQTEGRKRTLSMVIFVGLWAALASAVYKLVPGRGAHRVDLCQFNLPSSLWALAALVLLWAVSLSALLMIFQRPHVVRRMLAEIGFFSLPIFLLHEQMVGLWDQWIVLRIPEPNYQLRMLGSLSSVLLAVYSIIWFSRLLMLFAENFSYFGFVTDKK
jgi:hypothetical protein